MTKLTNKTIRALNKFGCVRIVLRTGRDCEIIKESHNSDADEVFLTTETHFAEVSFGNGTVELERMAFENFNHNNLCVMNGHNVTYSGFGHSYSEAIKDVLILAFAEYIISLRYVMGFKPIDNPEANKMVPWDDCIPLETRKTLLGLNTDFSDSYKCFNDLGINRNDFKEVIEML